MRDGIVKWCGCVALALGAVVHAAGPVEPLTDAGVVATAEPSPSAPRLAGDAGVVAKEQRPAQTQPEGPSFVEEHFSGTRVYASSSHYEVALLAGQGGLLFADGVAPIPLNGVVLRERNGLLSYLLTLVAGQALSAAVIASSAVEVSNVRSTRSTSTRYNADGSRTRVTTTTTSATVKQLKTQGQVDRETAAANRSLETGLVGHTFADLTIYAELPGLSALSGARPAGAGYELTVGGQGTLFELFELPVVLDVGFHLANVRVKTPLSPGLGGPLLYHSAGGVMGRLRVPLTRFAALSVEWVLNFLSFDYLFDPEDLLSKGSRPLSPLRFSLDLFATDHVFVRGDATFGALGVADGRLGFSLTAGVRL